MNSGARFKFTLDYLGASLGASYAFGSSKEMATYESLFCAAIPTGLTFIDLGLKISQNTL